MGKQKDGVPAKGEGNHEADRRYREETERFIASGKAADELSRGASRLQGRHACRIRSDQVLPVLDDLAALGVTAWVDGGWGVDALLGDQHRPHAHLAVRALRAALRHVMRHG